MGIFFGPLRVSKRGVRVRVGPRILRLHTGAGGAGISTGAGPFTAYAPLSGRKRRGTKPGQPKSPVFHGTVSVSGAVVWRCEHNHRTQAAASECAGKELRRREAERQQKRAELQAQYNDVRHHLDSKYGKDRVDSYLARKAEIRRQKEAGQ
jgi:hypothetical protein